MPSSLITRNCYWFVDSLITVLDAHYLKMKRLRGDGNEQEQGEGEETREREGLQGTWHHITVHRTPPPSDYVAAYEKGVEAFEKDGCKFWLCTLGNYRALLLGFAQGGRSGSDGASSKGRGRREGARVEGGWRGQGA
jgi:hypothetical protein